MVVVAVGVGAAGVAVVAVVGVVAAVVDVVAVAGVVAVGLAGTVGMTNAYDQYEDRGGRCRGCHKPADLCRCDSWGGPRPTVAENPVWTVTHFDLGLRRQVYSGAMTRTKALFMARLLAGASVSRRVAQRGTIKVLRCLPVLRAACTCPPRYGYEPEPRITRWTEKGRA